jgi:probable rRNA maturation factor
MPITFHQADIKFRVPDGTVLKRFIERQVKKETGKKIELSYVFCSDNFLLGINRQFLNHDFYTDIITFPLEQNEKQIKAEIYISVDRVRENASVLKIDLKEEMRRVMFHGVLHLMGHKDKNKTDKAKMRKKEDEWLGFF